MTNNKLKLDNYAIAYKYEDSERLCVYTFFNQVTYMSLEDAKEFRDRINKTSTDNYKIYKLVEVNDV